MKIFLKISLVSSFIFSSLTIKAQTDTTLIVNGVCNMCKRIIERSAFEVGANVAEWNAETKVLRLSYNPEKTDLLKISKSINDNGYDTEFETAPDEAYNKLHHCCHYRDPEVVKEHETKRKEK